ncbi:MAG TPA: hypothetical protein VIJ95_16780 [Hanamia sp.]
MTKKTFSIIVLLLCISIFQATAQNNSDSKIDLAPTPPMGWMTWKAAGRW